MKKLVFRFMMLALTVLLGLASCKDDADDSAPKQPSYPSVEEQQTEDWVMCQRSAFIYPDATTDNNLMEVFNQRFPNKVTSPDQAEVIVFGPNSEIDSDAFDVAVDKGAILAIVDPLEVLTPSTLEMFQQEMPGTDFSHSILFAFNTKGYCFNMLVDEEFDGNYDTDFLVSSQEIIEQSSEYGQANPEQTSERRWLYDNSYEHNYNYFQERIDPFVDFINDVYKNEAAKAPTRGVASKYNGDLLAGIENCAFKEYNIPVTLNHRITSDLLHWQSFPFVRNKNGSISVRVWSNSSYLFDVNGSDKTGDYYMVKTEVILHGKSLWQVSSEPGGFLDVGRCRIYGYWLDNLDLKFELVDAQGNNISASDYKYIKTPIPDQSGNNVGFEWGLHGVLNNNNGNDHASAFSLNVTDNTHYNAGGLKYSLKTESSNHSYQLWDNVKLTDEDYEDDAATNRNFPERLHGETSISSAWMWFIPAKESLGVGDRLKGSFGVRIAVIPRYATWFHWRAAAEYDNNKQVYQKPGDTRVTLLPAPDRDPWGIISIQCKKPGHHVDWINIFKENEFKIDGSGTPILRDATTKIHDGESAEFSVPEGTYVVVYHDNDESGMGMQRRQTVNVKSGTTPFNATTIITVQ